MSASDASCSTEDEEPLLRKVATLVPDLRPCPWFRFMWRLLLRAIFVYPIRNRTFVVAINGGHGFTWQAYSINTGILWQPKYWKSLDLKQPISPSVLRKFCNTVCDEQKKPLVRAFIICRAGFLHVTSPDQLFLHYTMVPWNSDDESSDCDG